MPCNTRSQRLYLSEPRSFGCLNAILDKPKPLQKLKAVGILRYSVSSQVIMNSESSIEWQLPQPQPPRSAYHVRASQNSVNSETLNSGSDSSTLVDDSTQCSNSTTAHETHGNERSMNFRTESGRARLTMSDITATWNALVELAHGLQQGVDEFNSRNNDDLELPWEQFVRDLVISRTDDFSSPPSLDIRTRRHSGSDLESRSTYSSSDDSTYRSESDTESERDTGSSGCGTQ